MKLRRIRIGFLLLCLLLSLILPASGAGSLYLVAVNDSLPFSLSDSTMPFYSDGTLYLPYSIFDATALNTVAVYSAKARTLSLSNNDGPRLLFNLYDGTVETEEHYLYAVSTISRNGTIYIPAVYTLHHFGYNVASMTSSGGYVVLRITTGSQIYDDALFLEKANNMIEYRVSQYLSAGTGSTGAVSGTVSPTDPVDSHTPANVYLAFTGTEQIADLNATLQRLGLNASFFFTEKELTASPTQILELAAAGHTIGIRLTGSEPDPVAAVEQANVALDRILQTKTLCVLTPARMQNTALQNAYFVIQENSRTPAAAAANEGGSLLVCSSTANGQIALNTLLQGECTISRIRETARFS